MNPGNRPSSRGFGLVVPRLRAFQRFWKDKNAASWKKLLLLLLTFYVVFPIDFVPDLVPIWGWLDDMGAMSFALLLLSWVLGPYTDSDTALAQDGSVQTDGATVYETVEPLDHPSTRPQTAS